MYVLIALLTFAAVMFAAAIVCLVIRRRQERHRRRDFSLLGQLCGLPVVASDMIPRNKAIVIDPSKIEYGDPSVLRLAGPTLYVHPDTLTVIRNVTDAL